jgi:RNA polymerase sigma-70 factor (ECF subfamily)
VPHLGLLSQVRTGPLNVSKPLGAGGRTTIVSALMMEPPRVQPRTPPDDGELVALALQGHSEAFATLVERYDRSVYHLAYRMLHHVEDARDATQEAFFKAFRSLHTFRPGAKFSTWIFAIAYHGCCDRLSRRKHDSGAEMPDRADPSAGPEQQTIAADEAERLRTAIAQLPEKYRAVITLFHLQGRQYDEIADVLGLPMGTVKTHLFRAKEQLRRLLGGMEVHES